MNKWLVGGAIAVVTAVAGAFLVVPVMLGALIGGSGSQGSAGICLIGGSVAEGGWTNPLQGVITSTFGGRMLEGTADHHDGTDIDGGDEGVPFYSASSGVVVAAYGTGGTAGNGDGGHGIIVDAGEGVQLWYWHAQAGSTTVKAGDKVKAGQHLANMGNTGRSTAAHLHFQVMVNGAAVDPVPFMKARGITLGQGGPSSIDTSPQTAAPGQPSGGSGQDFIGEATTGTRITMIPVQLGYVDRVIAQGRKSKMSDKAILILLVTALQESKFFMYANSSVPESDGYPHERVGNDHDSVGLVQQRPSMGWGTVEELMNPEKSALAFWGIHPAGETRPPGLLQISGWEKMSVNDAAQAVQVSNVPDAYGKWEPVAQALMKRVGSGGGGNVDCTSGNEFGAGNPMPGEYKGDAAREKIIAAAKEGLGGSYVWGGTAFKAWDCSGYVQWVMTKAGIKGIPRTEQWGVGKKTSNPQPGDLVVQNPDGPNHWAHVGIYAGDGMMYSALNPSVGTLLHPVDWNPGSEYFTMIGD
ncbi:peptidoglycan DD-metalloendopeptidase family protein [Arthrobacter cryoconiti]|uniref:Peptidoglycan DD-metalloendopeptidase family protein n=1 Tax=Arthrobacter cryoconiti TaxID=748907 RepID=A0ABV8R458_9MICC|nr:peptidoglycan DD-metalloendopeptidase family protein [Arthrobacter cryoconiti]MCC9069338.1 peptidoglycan DD-metalloendopeptidase family protein [Arthrobacter cryoconiti]